MTTETSQFNYDHAAYVARQNISLGVNTAGSNFADTVAVQPMRVYSATFVVVTAGTSAAGNTPVISMVHTGTATALATATVGTAAAGTVVNQALSTNLGGVLLAQGDYLTVTHGTDATAVNGCAIEARFDATASFTD